MADSQQKYPSECIVELGGFSRDITKSQEDHKPITMWFACCHAMAGLDVGVFTFVMDNESVRKMIDLTRNGYDVFKDHMHVELF